MKNNIKFILEPENNKRLSNLCGVNNTNLQKLENHFNVEINNRGHEFTVLGTKKAIEQAKQAIEVLFDETTIEKHITAAELNLIIQSVETDTKVTTAKIDTTLRTPKLNIKPRTPNQTKYVNNILKYDVNFGIGPAGSGKTYLAVAYAVAALETEQVARIIVARPVVEAGESLGFLPGDIAQKVDPYLRPIYDALYDMLGFSKTNKLIESRVIEIAPLAFMRGRTLNDAAIILDEAQNSTIEQMKMFLTRLGFNSKAIITGDITQTDLPKNKTSGLTNAAAVLAKTKGIGFTYFSTKDIVRHPLVQKIVTAYEMV